MQLAAILARRSCLIKFIGVNGMAEEKNMVRVNTRIPRYLNEWMDEQAKEMGIPKTVQIMLALELYYNQKNAPKQMDNLGMMLKQMQELSDKLDKE